MKVLLKDVVCRIKEVVDKDNTDLQYYVGGEHFESGEYRIHMKGIIKESTIGPAFHMRFQPGDVLLMSRNPHLRKAAMVDFSGICSDVSYVCRTKDSNKLLQRFIPILFQTDQFWTFATENKKGSTNFFLNWSDFERYEFNLPSLEEQCKLADLLWAAYDLKESYKRLLAASDEMAKSRFVEMFGDTVNNTFHWDIQPLHSVSEIVSGITKGRKTKCKELINVPYMSVANVKDGYIDWTNLKTIDATPDELKQYQLIKDDILITEGGDPDKVGRGAILTSVPQNCIHQNHIFRVRLFQQKVTPVFFAEQLRQPSAKQYFLNCAKQTTGIASINMTQLRSLPVILPPLSLQNEFSSFVKQLDKSKVALQKSIENLDTVIKNLLNKTFTEEIE